jgi:hypothetical protein
VSSDDATDGSDVEGLVERVRQVAPRLADVLEATTRRRDVLAARLRVVLLLLRARCPLGAVLRRRWYVPGAVARLGARGLLRSWLATFPGVEAPSERRLRGHLQALESDLVLVRAPGDWIPTLPRGDGRRSRWPDTFHVLEDDDAAEFWSTTGAERLAAHPDARTNPTVWRAHFAEWRGRRPVQRTLWETVEALAARLSASGAGAVAQLVDLRHAEQLRQVALLPRDAPPHALLAGLEAAGCALRGRNRDLAQKDAGRLRGAAAVLSLVLRRGRCVRNGSGFLVAAWRRADPLELEAAVAQAAAG